ncbi:Sll0314/Alr1548 family TPR repeat-containing protein [Leptolyngbya sp. KIOST-1]|uniref:Sll0314/Alr1548 family TPR repeat-containing protein n=1 Tax=Leptolyngbya sp. KIOST-1 TaxID=1229172 RepID=UPI000907B842|nr:Sll0314/Alr1548 family TPR repeat-containing protein [Leptolyngbya sp. KIOST-1]
MVLHARLASLRLGTRLKALSAGTLTVAFLALAPAAQAGDPFRTTNPHNIGEKTEAVFNALFFEGNYTAAEALVGQAIAAEPHEPMNYAIAAALGYLNRDLTQLAQQAQRTQQTATALKATDPLRGHLYTAVGIFMEGAHTLQTQGIARGTPTALRLLQRVFRELEAAEQINPSDPELSLLKGFMDLLLAVNLPFANPDQAIARLQNGHPDFLTHRGIAIGMRDMGRYSEALAEVDKALAAAPENPDLLYLKAQILFLQQQYAASLPFYRSALTYADQLPASTARQIAFEACQAEGVASDVCVERSRINEG